MADRLRIAVVGAGGIAEVRHLPAISALDALELVAVCDVDRERLAAFAARNAIEDDQAYLDVAEMLERAKPDLVAVCTPPNTHAPLAEQILRSGAWAYVEKPPCASLAELDEIAAVEQETGQRCTFVFQMRFGSGAGHLRRLIAAGDLGRPLVALCQTMWYRDADYYAVPWRGTWASEVGGPTVGHGIHSIDLLLHLLGEWAEVVSLVDRLDLPVETEDVSFALVRFASGARASIVTSVLSPRQETYLRLDFTEATVELRHLYDYSNADWRFTARPGSASALTSTWEDFPGDEPSSHRTQLAAIAGARTSGAEPPTGVAAVRPTMELLTAIYRSARTGRPVRRGDIRPGNPHYRSLSGGSPWDVRAGHDVEAAGA